MSELNRHQLFVRFQMKFSSDFKKAMEGFSPDEQIHILDALIEIVKLHQKPPADYDVIGKIMEGLQKKYRSRFKNFYNVKLITYFDEQSLRHLDMQEELKIEKVGYEESFFTEEERQEFLRCVEKLLKLHKEMQYLFSEPESQQKESLGDAKLKKKTTRARADNETLLLAEQTALLVPVLQRARIFLPKIVPSYAGEAMEVLTGYSADSIRQLLGPKEIKSLFTERNLKELHNSLNRAITVVEMQLRELKKNAKPS
jgi:hypothetical protein